MTKNEIAKLYDLLEREEQDKGVLTQIYSKLEDLHSLIGNEDMQDLISECMCMLENIGALK